MRGGNGSRALPTAPAPMRLGWNGLAEPRQPGAGRKICLSLPRPAFERAVGANRMARAQDVAALEQGEGRARHQASTSGGVRRAPIPV